MISPLYPCLWFDGQAEAAAEHYCSIFRNARILSADPMVVHWEIDDRKFMGLNGGPMYQFSPATSFVIECETQEEIDHYWTKLGEGGNYNQCGWLDDKFGVSWQIIPKILSSLMSNPEKREGVMAAFLKMQKFDIDTLLKV